MVSAPPGPDPQIDDVNSEQPLVTPEVPGMYTLELTVTPAGGGPFAVDQVTVMGSQTESPMGVPIQTITDAGAVQVGTEVFNRDAGGVKVLVLSATGLLPVAGPWGPAEQTFVPQGNGQWSRVGGGGLSLVETVEKAGNKTIVIISGQGEAIAAAKLSSSQSSHLAKALELIGGTVATYGQTAHGAADLFSGQWSVIGHRSLAEGHAEQNFGIAQSGIPPAAVPDFPRFPDDGGAPGSLNGYMQFISEAAYQYISPEFISFDTKWTPSLDQQPSTTQNTIAIGSERYESGSIADGSIAIQVLVLSGDSPPRVLDQGTYAVLDSNCATDHNGILALSQKLGQWANEPRPASGPAGSNLIVMQDFGRQAGYCWPGGNDTNWLQDVLPKVSGDGSGWVGSKFPTSRTDLLKMWNGGNIHGGTVAGWVGKLAGAAAHDAVANYRRPFYDAEAKQTFNRDFGGLTLVASSNLYQREGAFFQGQGDDPAVTGYGRAPQLDNGRVTGVLRRNEQSQWELRASAQGAGWAGETGPQPLEQEALFELIFQEPKEWPCTPENPAPCPTGVTQQIEAAHRYFVSQVSEKSDAASLRDLYADEYKEGFSVNAAERPYPQQPTRFGYFSKQVYAIMQQGVDPSWHGLVGELEAVNQVARGIERWQNFFEKGDTRVIDIQGVGNAVVKEVNHVYSKLLKENKEAEMDGAIASSVLYSFADIIDVGLIASGNPEAIPIAAPAVSAIAGGIDLGEDSADMLAEGAKEGQGNVANDTEAIRDRVSSLSGDIAARYERIGNSLEHFGGILVDDPEKLREAGASFSPGGPWAMPSKSQTLVRMGQAMGASVQRAAYETTLPMALTQWVVSPLHTNKNPGGSPDLPEAGRYACTDTNSGGGADNRNPWKNSPESAWTMASIGWSGGGPTRGTTFTPQNSTNYTIRGLKVNANNMHPDRPEGGGEPGLQHTGSTPKAELLEPLFGSYSAYGTAAAPGHLGADKEQIFGLEDWSARKFQCGWSP